MTLIEFRQCVGDCTILGRDFSPIPCQVFSLLGSALMAFLFVTILFIIIITIKSIADKLKKKKLLEKKSERGKK